VKIVHTLQELASERAALVEPVGFVPTMGYLHEGHLSLVRTARQDCAQVAASIFVNPTQFGPNEDFAAYPRDQDGDLAKLESAGVNLVWLPTPEILYPPGFQTWVTVEDVSQPLEGRMRPGHFRGVATVVAKLFNAIRPQYAYFGQKDAQQVAVIRRMILDLNFPVQMHVCPTLREPDGLAMSSRNAYLNSTERQAAGVLFQALKAAREFHAQRSGQFSAEEIRQTMLAVLSHAPLARVQYVSCADLDTLQELEGALTPSTRLLLSMAVFLGKTRLIDNFMFDGSTWLIGAFA
jgi:pantoate--beta-alanine ligase